jgi:hypothetical protein
MYYFCSFPASDESSVQISPFHFDSYKKCCDCKILSTQVNTMCLKALKKKWCPNLVLKIQDDILIWAVWYQDQWCGVFICWDTLLNDFWQVRWPLTSNRLLPHPFTFFGKSRLPKSVETHADWISKRLILGYDALHGPCTMAWSVKYACHQVIPLPLKWGLDFKEETFGVYSVYSGIAFRRQNKSFISNLKGGPYTTRWPLDFFFCMHFTPWTLQHNIEFLSVSTLLFHLMLPDWKVNLIQTKAVKEHKERSE